MRRWLTRLTIPVALVVATVLASAPQSSAGTTDTVSVQLDLRASTMLDASGCDPATAGTLTLARTAPSPPATRATSACVVEYGTANGTGARLLVHDQDDSYAMSSDGLGAAPRIPDLGLGPVVLDSSIGVGICLDDAGTGANAVPDLTESPGCATSATAWHGLPSTPRQVAHTTDQSLQSARMFFGGRVARTQQPDSYSGVVTFEVLSP